MITGLYEDQSRVIYRSPLDRSQFLCEVAYHLAETSLSDTFTCYPGHQLHRLYFWFIYLRLHPCGVYSSATVAMVNFFLRKNGTLSCARIAGVSDIRVFRSR